VHHTIHCSSARLVATVPKFHRKWQIYDTGWEPIREPRVYSSHGQRIPPKKSTEPIKSNGQLGHRGRRDSSDEEWKEHVRKFPVGIRKSTSRYRQR
jgi:hypothetical protein